MKAGLLIVSIALAMSANASGEESTLQECLDAAKKGILSDTAESEAEMLGQSYANAIDICLQDHLTPYASSDEFSDEENELDSAGRRFHQFDASRRSVGRRSSSMYESGSRNPTRSGSYPQQRQRSTHQSRRVVMPRPTN